LNQILHVADDIFITGSLTSLIYVKEQIKFFITKAENDNNKRKRQIKDRTISLPFFKRKWFQKTIF